MVIACTRDCYDTCIFDDNYKPLKSFPFLGFTCSRGNADLRRNKINRVLSPLVEGKETSLEDSVKYISKIIKETPKDKIIHVEYDGNQGLLTWYYPARLWNLLGTLSIDYSICASEGHEAIKAHYGSSFGALPEEFEKYDSVVFWGSESAVSFIHGWKLLQSKYKITVDVRISETARRSDKYYLVRPGSDGFLAVGVMKRIFARGVSADILDDEATLREYVNSYTWDEIESVTGLNRKYIEELGDLYYDRRPLTIIGFALGRTYYGGDAVSLISLIPALLGLRRGFFYSNSQGWGIDFSYLRGLHLSKPARIAPMGKVGEEVEKGNIKVIFAWNSNPIHSLPNSDRIVEAIKEGRLTLIMHDPFINESVKLSNVVIPSPTFLEKRDVVYSYWHDYLVYNEPICEPKGVDEIRLMRLIAKQLGISHPLIEEDEWKAVDYAIRRTGVSLEELVKNKVVKVKRYYDGFQKVKVNPLPRLKEPPVGEYLVFSSHPNHTNSQFNEIYDRPKPIVYNCCYEGEGYLESDFGKIRVIFKISERVPKGVYYMYKSGLFDLDDKPVNSIVNNAINEYGGTPQINFTKVRAILK
ncbi:molybdopterin-dependent oxidoreductase [Sulfolobus acidocaldarius]|uniref:Molybdopterin oxidoreductase n=4 Tax=Sulfolobus acidocaldarius TaxID=2285 RepID=Q4JBQ0_SULAC|nr:molybdopterin-dependent oxidoreductase [Sulfolobus acidocaldarius]AAY79779.1 molybdopterin oxidoreductase [Sulfolobus acidocaldarius DSM 639]AGE70337.1 molybdopterin oxidoreductase [Sulfolobus acidocaldarius N8]AGE72612.1 molybdopterin oxidoreductase [Sulfolobus acidocaldarius Ron12/I]ALU29264.1 dehydrogenase [Sulfolobus acidocaldarius]ALU31993.1 dehydrogenase [Sulfolobus acidocaldarius]